MERRIVCGRCAKIKQACDGGNPCSRCKRLDVICESSLLNGSRSLATATLNSRPARITRTHTGCATCKKRKRKCDEARPKCSDCRRLCLDCHYPAVSAQTHRKGSSPGPATAAASPVRWVESSPVPQNLTSGTLEFGLYDLEDTVEAPGSNDFPVWWPGTSPSQTSNDGSDNMTTTSDMDLSLTMLSTVPSLTVGEDRSLLNHYMKVVAVVLSRRNDHRSNPYLSNVVPMAFTNHLVMEAVLALSASHWKRLQPTMWRRGIVHQTNALKSLAKLLPHINDESADVALSATLLLAMVDLFDGTSSHWKFHLDGVRQLLSAFRNKSDWSRSSQHRTFYNQLYHYLDSATTISTCHPPLLEASKTEDSGSLPYSTDDEEALYGIPKSLFHFVDKINGLAYQRKFRDDSVFESMFQASAASLQKEIEQWVTDHKLDEPSTGTPGSQELATYHATIAFEQALQLRLHQVVNGYSLSYEKVKQCVSSILESIQEIHYGNALESSLVFPLVMAGTSCDEEHERLIVHDRFLVMERTLGFRYLYIAHDLVQRVWKERQTSRDTGREVNWAAIRYYHIPGLALV